MKTQEKMQKKIDKLRQAVNNKGLIKASVFDNTYNEAKIKEDPRGGNWNPFVHREAKNNGIKIIKFNGHNYYDKDNNCGVKKIKK